MKSETIWFAVDKDGEQYAYELKPERDVSWWRADYGEFLELPEFMTIEKITGKKLSWEDEPLEWHPPR